MLTEISQRPKRNSLLLLTAQTSLETYAVLTTIKRVLDIGVHKSGVGLTLAIEGILQVCRHAECKRRLQQVAKTGSAKHVFFVVAPLERVSYYEITKF